MISSGSGSRNKRIPLFKGNKSFKNYVEVLGNVYLKVFENTVKNTETNNYNDFLNGFKKFCSYGKTCYEEQMKDSNLNLKVPDIDYSKSPKHYSNVDHIMDLGKQLVENATNLISDALEETRSKNRVFKGNEGPMSEIRYWISISTKLGKLYDHLSPLSKSKKNEDSAQFGIEISKMTKDDKMKFIREMVEYNPSILEIFDNQYQELSKVLVKARDNVKFLETLNRHFKTIDRCDGTTLLPILDTLPSMMRALQMVWIISRHYNTEKQMLPLMMLIAHEIAKKVKEFVNIEESLKNIFSDPKKVLAIFTEGIRTLQKWKDVYFQFRKQVDERNNEVRWDFDTEKLFGKTEFIKLRLIDLSVVGENILKYKLFLGPQMTNVGNKELSNTVLEDVKKLIDPFQKFEGIFDFGDQKEWQTIKDKFKVQLKIVEKKISDFVTISFEQLSSSKRAFKLLQDVQKNKDFASLGSDEMLKTKKIQILKRFGEEVENIYKIFCNEKENPPKTKNMPDVVSRIYWAKLLIDKIKSTVDIIRKEGNGKVFDESEEGLSIKEKCVRIVHSIRDYSDKYFNDWKASFEKDGTNLLKNNIFSGDYQKLKDIKVNFDPRLNQLIQETRYMERLFNKKKKISDIAINITLQADKYHELIESLKGMIDNLISAITVLGRHERSILKPKEKELIEVIKPGFTVLNWNSLGIPAYIKRCNEKIAEFSGIVTKVEKNVAIINGLINQIKQTNLSIDPRTLEGKKLDLSGLYKIFEENINENVEYIRKKYKMITQTLMKVEGELISTNLIASSSKISSNGRVEILQSYYFHIEKKILRALLRVVKYSLKRISLLRKTPGVLKIVFSLVNNEIVETPTKEDIKTIIEKILNMIVHSTKKVPRFLNGTCIPITKESIKLESTLKKSNINVEQILMEKFSFYVQIALFSGLSISKYFFSILKGIVRTTNRIDKLREFYERFGQYWKIPIDPAIKKFQEQNPQSSDYENRLEDCQKLVSDIDSHSKQYVMVDFLEVDLKVLLDAVQKQARKWIESYGASLHNRTKPILEELEKNMKEKSEELELKIESIQDLRNVLSVLDEIRESYSNIEGQYLEIESIYSTLDNYKVSCLNDEYERALGLQQKWSQLMLKGKTIEKRIIPLKKKFRQQTIEDISNLKKTITQLNKKFESGPMNKLMDEEMKECKESLTKILEKRKEYQLSEKLFDLPITAYPILTKLERKIESANKMYELNSQFVTLLDSWSKTPFGQIQLETMRQKTKKFLKKLRSDFNGEEMDFKIHSMIKQKVRDFTNSIPLFASLRSDDLRDRHWNMIMEKTGVHVDTKSEDFTLEKLIKMELFKYSEVLEEIFSDAKKEITIENLLKQVSESWRNRRFVLVEHVRDGKNRGKIIGGKTEIMEALEEDSTSIAGVGGTRHALPFSEEISKFEKILIKIEDVLNLWMETQKMWINLEVIFIGSQDIRQQLKRQAQAFDKIEADWQKMMGEVTKVRNVKECVFVDGRFELLKRLYSGLQTCQKGLTDYLHTKRCAFPRFFYLSDEELLSVLGKSDVDNVQKQVTKMFNNSSALLLKKNSKTVIGMISNEGEEFVFKNQIQPSNVVEKWLSDVEKEMKSSLHRICKESVFFYPRRKRIEWIQENYGQVGLVGSQIWWTWEVENSFEDVKKGNKMAVKVLSQKLTSQIGDLVKKIRSKISRQDRKKINTLIIIDVHARDIVDTLVRDSILDKREFEWESQLRFYWDKKRDTILIRQCTGEFDYGMEYQGLNGRLVITPLTDRCFMTLTQALTFHLGGSPAGPAGTGKTESVKDLAKSMGNLCIVFNCSEGLNYQAMSKIFSGLCQNGAWGCFDEFNRIELPVLSVVSTQIRTIQDALSKKVKNFRFDGLDIKLDWKTGVFVTMNPGYAGRVELPDNLKALFRPITMVVPDSDIICEIMLFSQGFDNARRLSRKMIKLYKLAKGQLSKQCFYDWGLRALKAILNKAGELKRLNPDVPEDGLLMKAIYDMNIAKFVYEDVPLFEDLLKDLFVEMNIDKTSNEVFQKAIREELQSQGYKLMDDDFQVGKVVQLYETMNSRHSTMVVGGTTGGKSVVINTLAKAQTKLGFKTKLFLINPKAQTVAELYGELDEDTREWTDGVLSSIFRKINIQTEDPNDRRYLLFDGDVDAVWIESMNSVMDDNKWFTLAHGERIQLIDQCKLLFEVSDLQYASPATVSRCGMVFVDPKNLGIENYIWSWLHKKFPEDQESKKLLQRRFSEYAEKAIAFVLEGTSLKAPLGTVIPQTKINLIKQMCNILDFLVDSLGKERSPDVLDSLFVFALIWSIGGSIVGEKRKEFDTYFRKILEMRITNNEDDSKEIPAGTIPSEDTLYDYFFDTKALVWKRWDALVNEYHPPDDGKFSSILVPTVDTVRYDYFLKNLLNKGSPVLFVGIPGTSKTVIIKSHLAERMKNDTTEGLLNFYFSGRTTSLDVQKAIEDRIERKGGSYAPKGCNILNVFIDELNMPNVDIYGTQQPIAFLKMLIEKGGFYERANQQNSLNWLKVKNINYVGSFCPASVGRNPVDPRFVSMFNLFCLTFPSNDSLRKIFFSILNKHLEPFTEPIRNICGKITDSTLELYNFILEKLPPTPSKFHYVFNLRDISRVFEGLCASTIDCFQTDYSFARLWRNECSRIFVDRLISKKDMNTVVGEIDRLVEKNFSENSENIKKAPMLYGDFNVDFRAREVIRLYQDMEDYSVIRNVVENQLEEYNEISELPLNIVLFDQALEHLTRIHRIIRIEGGHAMLIGVGGSGKKSLVRLATHLAGYELFRLKLSRGYGESNFKDDMKDLFQKLGVENQKIVFMFQDSDIIEENFLEHINNLLTSGYLPALFESDERDSIISQMANKAKTAGVLATKENIWKYFLGICKENLHVVMCMSPNEELKKRCRNFPGLINCSTIDWFFEWPKQALYSVAKHFLQEGDETFEDLENIVNHMILVHLSVVERSKLFLQEKRRYNHVTPKNYLDFIGTFKKILKKKRKECDDDINKYTGGVNILEKTKEDVSKMQDKLKETMVVVEKKQVQVNKLLEEINQNTEKAEKEKAASEENKKKLEVQTAEIEKLKEESEKLLKEAEPILESAKKAVEKIDKTDITYMKSFKNPQEHIKAVGSCVVILFEGPGEKNWVPSWLDAQRIFSDTSFLTKILTFEKDKVTPKTIKKLKEIMKEMGSGFTSTGLVKISPAAGGILQWVEAMVDYQTTLKKVKPLRDQLERYTKGLEKSQKELDRTAEVIRGLEELLAKLRENLEKNQKEANVLQERADKMQRKLDAAQKIISGLSQEKDRWEKLTVELKEQRILILGDCLIASGFLCYLASFTVDYRNTLIYDMWEKDLMEKKIPRNVGKKVNNILSNEVEMAQWESEGLPSDEVSIQNGILTTNSSKFSICIDPQNQAYKWLKQKIGKNDLEIRTFHAADFFKKLESSMKFGKKFLFERVDEFIDPIIDPILNMDMTKKQRKVKFGEDEIEVDEGFNLYLCTNLSNPRYSPEIQGSCLVVNYSVTYNGLIEQLLNEVVKNERPELETKRKELIQENSKNKTTLSQLENKILSELNIAGSSGQSLIDNDEVVTMLDEIKNKVHEINEKLEAGKITNKEIQEASEVYRKVAVRGAILFFVINGLGKINKMYEYSLECFMEQIFVFSLKKSEYSNILSQRLNNIIDFLTKRTYTYVCSGLFEKDKLTFSLILALRICEIDEKEIDFFMKGNVSLEDVKEENVFSSWLSKEKWKDLNMLINLGSVTKDGEVEKKSPFCDVIKHLKENEQVWKDWYDKEQIEEEEMPNGYSKKLTDFQQLCLLRCFRVDRILKTVRKFITQSLGSEFYVRAPILDYKRIYKESTNLSPLLCLISPGFDPASEIIALSRRMKEKCIPISLGQGQGVKAVEAIKRAMQKGYWVLLQNCHLLIAWMVDLEKILDTDEEKVHKKFRLWMTSEVANFPISILQKSLKIVTEPPSNLKLNMVSSYSALISEKDDSANEGIEHEAYKSLVYVVTYFHAVILERKKYGKIGWNVPYDFNNSDYSVSLKLLRMYLDKSLEFGEKKIPWNSLKYLIGEAMYGGRVTDDFDRRVLITYLNEFMGDFLFDKFQPFFFSRFNNYALPEKLESEKLYLSYVEQNIKLENSPEVIGLHPNAEITYLTNRSKSLWSKLMMLQGGGLAGGGEETSAENSIMKITENLLVSFPKEYIFNRDAIKKEIGDLPNPIQVVLLQELEIFNKLLTVMRKTLFDLKRALMGEIRMSNDLEVLGASLNNGKVPQAWMNYAPVTKKGLSDWLNHLKKRYAQYKKWVDDGEDPDVIWLSGLHIPESYITSIVQVCCKKKKIPLDKTVLFTEITKFKSEEEVKEKPPFGCYVKGLFIEGAMWDQRKNMLVESKKKVLIQELPIMKITPLEISKLKLQNTFLTPVYYTTDRGNAAGVGLCFEANMRTFTHESHWILKGVALSLNDD